MNSMNNVWFYDNKKPVTGMKVFLGVSCFIWIACREGSEIIAAQNNYTA